LVRTLPQWGGIKHLYRSASQGLDFLPQQPSQSTPHVEPHAPPWGSLQPRQPAPHPGSGAQKSSHSTTQTCFFTSFISHTTRQYFRQQPWQPHRPQQSAAPQTSVQQAGGRHASPAGMAGMAPNSAAKDISRILMVSSPCHSYRRGRAGSVVQGMARTLHVAGRFTA